MPNLSIVHAVAPAVAQRPLVACGGSGAVGGVVGGAVGGAEGGTKGGATRVPAGVPRESTVHRGLRLPSVPPGHSAPGHTAPFTQVRYRDARYSAHPNAHPCRHPPLYRMASRRRPCRLPCRPRRPRKNEKLIVRSSIKATRSRRRRTPRLHHGRSSIGCAGAQRSSAVRTASGPRLSSRGWDVEGLAGRGARRARRTGGGPRRRSVSSRGSA